MKNLGFLIGLLILGGVSFLKQEKILPQDFMSVKFGYKLETITVLVVSFIAVAFALFILFA